MNRQQIMLDGEIHALILEAKDLDRPLSDVDREEIAARVSRIVEKYPDAVEGLGGGIASISDVVAGGKRNFRRTASDLPLRGKSATDVQDESDSTPEEASRGDNTPGHPKDFIKRSYDLRQRLKDNNNDLSKGEDPRPYKGSVTKRGMGGPAGELLDPLFDMIDMQVELSLKLEDLEDPTASARVKAFAETWAKHFRWSPEIADAYAKPLRTEYLAILNAIKRKRSGCAPPRPAKKPRIRQSDANGEDPLLSHTPVSNTAPVTTQGHSTIPESGSSELEVRLTCQDDPDRVERRVFWSQDLDNAAFFQTVSAKFGDKPVRSVLFRLASGRYTVEPSEPSEPNDEWEMVRKQLVSYRNRSFKVDVRLA